MSLGAPFGSLYISGKWPLHLCRVQRGQIVVLNDSPVRYREHKIGNDFFWRGMVDFTGLQVPIEWLNFTFVMSEKMSNSGTQDDSPVRGTDNQIGNEFISGKW